MISACSYALDCIEAELVNIKNKHGKRVAYISVRMGQYFDLPEDAPVIRGAREALTKLEIL